jgi:radical SAM superfamily enzyme YgiQ (UPF0313 family)
VTPSSRDRIRQRLADETGRLSKQAPTTIALAYPSPYSSAMSSLGFQRIYRAIMESPGLACERAFLDDEAETDLALATRPVTYESMRPLEAFPIVAFSVAYEIELQGLVAMLLAADIPPKRIERDDRHPFILAGGPLTFSNPLPLAGLVDAIIVGEAEELVIEVIRTRGAERCAREDRPRLRAGPSRRDPPPGRQGLRRARPGLLGDSHAAHRARQHVPHRERAGVLPVVHVLRDAPLDERRHADRADGRHPLAHPGGREAGGARGGGRQ